MMKTGNRGTADVHAEKKHRARMAYLDSVWVEIGDKVKVSE